MTYYLAKDISEFNANQIICSFPEEVIKGLIADLKKEKYKYVETTLAPSGHWFWFVITNTGECGIVSGVFYNVWFHKNFVFGNADRESITSKIPNKYKKLFKNFISNILTGEELNITLD